MNVAASIAHWRDARTIFEGVLLGTAVGDALGLPAEGLPAGRIRRWWRGEWKMRFVAGHGMTSDDTEHSLMVAQCLLSHPSDPAAFQRALGWKFRWWFAGLPAGVGLATARACLKLWFGFKADRSGVNSAGDGPAMRSAVLGAYFAEDAQRRREFVTASTRLTHRNRKAETAALAIAEAAALAVREPNRPEASRLLPLLRELSGEKEWHDRLTQIEISLERNDPVQEFANALGLAHGVSGYSLHAVPVALYAWCRHCGNFRDALIAALECGGDTDTVGAMVGALCGASHGAAGIPEEWIGRIVEWPRSIAFIRETGQRLAKQQHGREAVGEVHYFWPGLLLRNLVFLVIVVLHGFRRLLPPY